MFKFGRKKEDILDTEEDLLEDDFISEEDLRQQEHVKKVNQRIKSVSIRKLRAEEKKRKKEEKESLKDKWRESQRMFTELELVITFLLHFIVHFGLFYYLSNNIIVSIIIGFVGVTYTFLEFTYPNRKLKLYQDDLDSLLQYVLNMNFFIANKQNVLHSLMNARTQASPRIRPDIDKTIRHMEDTSMLDTEHFRKYKFPTLNQFHDNLNTYNERSGDPDKMFTPILDSMSYELGKRDELHRRRKGFSVQVYVLLGLVSLIGAILKNVTPEMWIIFIEFPILGIGTLVVTYTAILFNLKLLQNHNMDISVR